MVRIMRISIKALFPVSILMLAGCVTVNFLPTDESVVYDPTNSVKVFWQDPREEFIVIGRVTVESADYSEEELFKNLKQKAMEVGAHAIIMSGSSQQSSAVGVPVYGGGTIITPVTSRRLEAVAIRINK